MPYWLGPPETLTAAEMSWRLAMDRRAARSSIALSAARAAGRRASASSGRGSTAQTLALDHIGDRGGGPEPYAMGWGRAMRAKEAGEAGRRTGEEMDSGGGGALVVWAEAAVP